MRWNSEHRLTSYWTFW